MFIDPVIEQRAKDYGRLKGIGLNLKSPLGSGTDGAVWASSRQTAVKAMERRPNYNQELTCYQRFAKVRLTKLGRFNVPKLVGHDDELMIVEMGIVNPPYILDFGKVSLDRPPDYEPEVMAESERDHAARFTAGQWEDVQMVLWLLKTKFGIYYLDPKPGNIMFKDWQGD